MPRSIVAHAPAKLNLALSVGPPAPSLGGFHPIASWMMTVNLLDELTLTRLEPGVLSRYAILWHKDARRRSDINWSLNKDLAVRAHQALEKWLREAGRIGPCGLAVQMKLEKRIPVGGGLGGGSSNAAAMLRALNDLFELDLSREQLASIGASLGSDVPFLVRGGSAIVEGLGERLTPHQADQTPILHAVVAFPDIQCPTPRVYAVFDESGEALLRTEAVRDLAAQQPRLAPDAPFNDLAEAAMRIAPRLREDLAALSHLAERPAHVTGSGSSIFVLCDDEMHAAALADAVTTKLSLPAVAVRNIGPM